MPSATLLGQSVLSGIFIGALYGLLGLGLSLSWGMLRQVNLAHFALAFLGGYLTFQLSGAARPFVTLAVVAPVFFVARHGLHWFLPRFSVSLLNTLLVTFGLTSIIEAGIQWNWTADFHRMESAYAAVRWKIGPLFVSLPDAVHARLRAAPVARRVGRAALHRPGQGDARHDRGRADRGRVRRQREAARLLRLGLCAALRRGRGLCLALNHTLAPAQIYAWMGVVFAAVMMGGLGRPIGPLVAGIVIGVSEALDHGGHRTDLGAAGVVLAPDRRCCCSGRRGSDENRPRA